MAYLNCPFCPSQAFLVEDMWVLKTQSTGMTLEKYRCASKHEFYVEKEETE